MPSAESLYSSAETAWKSDRKEAREKPIAEFLRHYPNHDKSGQVQAWADQYDLETLDKQMHNRRGNVALKFTPGPEETTFNQALNLEKEGNLAEAAKLWESLIAKKANADPEMHAWGLLGEHYLKDHRESAKLYERLNAKLRADKDAKSSNPFEQCALDAVRAERAGNSADAASKWTELAKMPDVPRAWELLAFKQQREMNHKKDDGKREQGK